MNQISRRLPLWIALIMIVYALCGCSAPEDDKEASYTLPAIEGGTGESETIPSDTEAAVQTTDGQTTTEPNIPGPENTTAPTKENQNAEPTEESARPTSEPAVPTSEPEVPSSDPADTTETPNDDSPENVSPTETRQTVVDTEDPDDEEDVSEYVYIPSGSVGVGGN